MSVMNVSYSALNYEKEIKIKNVKPVIKEREGQGVMTWVPN